MVANEESPVKGRYPRNMIFFDQDKSVPELHVSGDFQILSRDDTVLTIRLGLGTKNNLVKISKKDILQLKNLNYHHRLHLLM